MSAYPNYASFFLRSYSNVSHQNFLVEPAASAQLQAHRSMQFTLPTNTNLLMKNTKLLFTMSTAGGGTTHGRLAAARSIIDRCELTMGGVMVTSGVAQQAVLTQCLANMKEEPEDPVISHSKAYRRVSGVNLVEAEGASEAYSTAKNTAVFSCDLGAFFSTIQPQLFPTALCPQIGVQLFLSGNATVAMSITNGDTAANMTTAGNQQATYTVDNYRLLVDAWSIDDGVFSSVLATRLQSEGSLDAIFCDYEGFSDTYNGSTRLSSAASSLDKVFCVWRKSTYAGINAAQPLLGYNTALAAAENTNNVLDQSLTRGGDYLSAPLTFTVPTTGLPSAGADNFTELPEISISVNGVRFPSFDAKSGAQSYELAKQAFEVDRTQSQSLVEYLENRFVVAYKFNLPASGAMRARSGLNLQGSNSTILVQNVGDTTNNATNFNIMTFVESSKILSIGVGKQISVIS